MTVRVLWRDETLCFVDKPAGLLVHNSAWAGPREATLVEAVHDALGDAWHPLHRLDRQTSGVVAFAQRDAVAALQTALAAPETDKRYWALVRGHVTGAVDIDHPIVDDARGVDASERASRPARSRVVPLLVSTVERCSLVEVRLFSGRRHQARRHLKHIAHPVIGDATHGKGALNRDYKARFGVTRMALHARSLTFADGRGAVAPLPEDLRAPLALLFGEAIVELGAKTAT